VGAPDLGVHGPARLSGPPGPARVETELEPLTRDRRLVVEEVLVVLALSLLPSAFDALISLLSAPVAGISVATFPQITFSNLQLVQQVVDTLFSLAPVALVIHLARRTREGIEPFGLRTDSLGQDLGLGIAGGLGVAGVGLAIYLSALALKINRFVVPVPPLHHWWTVPLVVVGALQAGLFEEIIVVGYLIRRLEQLGWKGVLPVLASALLRGAYHLYQGWGGFTGTFLMGLAFGYAFTRWRRTWPLVVAHVTVDVLAGVGYILYRGHCFWGACIR
jgi:membrane protease YdiL (CAAX protease family)